MTMPTNTRHLNRRQLLQSTALLPLVGAPLGAPRAEGPETTLPKEMKWIVPSTTASATDIVARSYAQALAETRGVTITVLNAEGANGEIGLGRFLNTAPSGDTWLLGYDSLLTINPHFYPRSPEDILQGLEPVATVVQSPSFYLLVHPDDPIRTIKDLQHAARTEPQRLTYGSGGIGSQHHLLMEDLAARLGVELRHIPYRGNALSVQDLIRGEIRLLMAGASVLTHIQAGRLRIIAVTASRRLPHLPDIPAIGEIVPHFTGGAWFGLFGRRGVPAGVIQAKRELLQQVSASPLLKEALKSRGGFDVDHRSGSAFVDLIRADARRFASIVARLRQEKKID
jgi:tripartite-type tricarboxylate transporter receptor subunit TctC